MNRAAAMPIGIAMLAALLVASLGATMIDLGPWYGSLVKPDFTPPQAVFPVAWTTIFALTALAGVSAWSAAPTVRVADTVVGLFALNGFLNVLWSLMFFRAQRPDWAFAEMVVLWLSVAALILYCARFSRSSALLLVPYIAWVSVAGLLNWQVVQLNAPFG